MMKKALGLIALLMLAGCQAAGPPALVYVAGAESAEQGQSPGLDLYLIEPQTQFVSKLTNTEKINETDPCLDVDRKRVAYVARSADGQDEPSQLCVLSIESLTSQVIYTAKGQLLTPAWSNRGDRIAFCELVDGRLMLKVIYADGTGLVEAGFGSEPSWRMDDRALFYNMRDALDSKEIGLMVRKLKTGVIQSLSLRGNGFSNLQRGTSIVYTALPYSRRNEAVWLIDANSRQLRLSEPNREFRDINPVHINGTTLVAFTRIDVKTGKAAIYVVDRFAEEPIAVPLVEGEGPAYTRGGELLLNDQ